jgi:hypothetical protein
MPSASHFSSSTSFPHPSNCLLASEWQCPPPCKCLSAAKSKQVSRLRAMGNFSGMMSLVASIRACHSRRGSWCNGTHATLIVPRGFYFTFAIPFLRSTTSFPQTLLCRRLTRWLRGVRTVSPGTILWACAILNRMLPAAVLRGRRWV